MNNRLRFLGCIVAFMTFASSNGMEDKRNDLVYGDISVYVHRAREQAHSREVLREEQQARMLAEEQLQKRKKNIKAMLEKWDGPILQRHVPCLGDEERALLTKEQTQFVRGRDGVLGLLPRLARIDDPSKLALIGRTLRSTIVLGFKKGWSGEFIKQLVPIMVNVQFNKMRFPFFRSQPRYKIVPLLDDGSNENREELESERLGRRLEIKWTILRIAGAWNGPMIQDSIQLPEPNSSEVLRLDTPHQQFVGPRDYLLKLWRGRQKDIQKVSTQELGKQHQCLKDLIDLGCREGLSAQVIAGLLHIGFLREQNKKLFANLVRHASHEKTPAITEAYSDFRLVCASGYAKKRGQRECFCCFGRFDQSEFVSLCGRDLHDTICKNCFPLNAFARCPLCMRSPEGQEE